MQLLEEHSLKQYNTFGIECIAQYFSRFKNIEELREILSENRFKLHKQFILGGGSNILFTKNFEGFVIKNEILGKRLVQEDEDFYYVKVGAGEIWHDFVQWCIACGYNGLENLSLIPGNVGASPMQNIGAYGVELKDRFYMLEALNRATGDLQNFNNTECEFGYRESVFKRRLKDQFIITSVTFKLPKQAKFDTSYGAIEQELERLNVSELSAKVISEAVINIRRSKLPNPVEIGNGGSFFKNPVVENKLFNEIKSNHPQVVGYPVDECYTKLAAGWLIEHAGWKGKRINNYGVHDRQALVLVNHGGAKGSDIYNLSTRIIKSVTEQYGVVLEREVNII